MHKHNYFFLKSKSNVANVNQNYLIIKKKNDPLTIKFKHVIYLGLKIQRNRKKISQFMKFIFIIK